jgi:hypothetical protein
MEDVWNLTLCDQGIHRLIVNCNVQIGSPGYDAKATHCPEKRPKHDGVGQLLEL